MFGFLRRSQVHQPSPGLLQALAARALPLGLDPASLGVVETRGQYSGRSVTYFQVFDPQRAAERGVLVRAAADLEAHPELVLGAGLVEHDGTVVLNAGVVSGAVPAPARQRADRANHSEDEHFVFPDQPSS